MGLKLGNNYACPFIPNPQGRSNGGVRAGTPLLEIHPYHSPMTAANAIRRVIKVSASILESGAAADVLSRFHRATTRPLFKRHGIWVHTGTYLTLSDIHFSTNLRQRDYSALAPLQRARREPLPILDFLTVDLTTKSEFRNLQRGPETRPQTSSERSQPTA